MLSKRRRITRHDFPSDPRAGRVFHMTHFSLRATPARIPQARVSVVVSKKAAKRAVDRHLIKRRVYASVARAHELPAGLYVFFAKASAHTLTFRELHEQVAGLLLESECAIVKGARLV